MLPFCIYLQAANFNEMPVTIAHTSTSFDLRQQGSIEKEEIKTLNQMLSRLNHLPTRTQKDNDNIMSLLLICGSILSNLNLALFIVFFHSDPQITKKIYPLCELLMLQFFVQFLIFGQLAEQKLI